MAEETTGAAQQGAQGSGAAAGASGAAGAQQGNGQQQQAGQQQTGAQQQGATGQETGKTTEAGKAAGDTSQAQKPAPFVPKLPDGFKLADDTLKEFNAIFTDEKLTAAERQQKLVDLQVKQWQTQQRDFQDRLAAKPAQDLEALKTDKAFGGPNFQATIDGAKRIERLAFGEELGKLLSPYGMQSDPVIIKGLARLSRVIADDSVGTKTGDGVTETDADAEGRKQFPKSWDDMKKRSGKK